MKKYIASAAVVSLLAPFLAFAAPVDVVSITLSGPNPVTVNQGQSYNEPGFSANSTVDGNITGSVVSSRVDTSHAGNTSVNYFVTDSLFNTASASRSVTVMGGGGGLIFCSGPMAPGYRVDLPNGGCPQAANSTGSYVFYNRPLSDGTLCQFFFGCMDKGR